VPVCELWLAGLAWVRWELPQAASAMRLSATGTRCRYRNLLVMMSTLLGAARDGPVPEARENLYQVDSLTLGSVAFRWRATPRCPGAPLTASAGYRIRRISSWIASKIETV
jgi:hypothetical protein